MTKTVRRNGLPDQLTEEQRAELRALADRNEVDTSDIPEATEEWFERAERGRMLRRYNDAVLPMIDGAILEWLRPEEPGFRDRLNDALRDAMKRERDKLDHPEAAE